MTNTQKKAELVYVTEIVEFNSSLYVLIPKKGANVNGEFKKKDKVVVNITK